MNSQRIEALASWLGLANALAGLYALVAIVLWIVKGSDWFAHNLLPLQFTAFMALSILAFLVLIPLMVVRATRPYAGLMLLNVSYYLGGITWFYSAHFCLTALGKFWLLIGTLGGVLGVVPIATIGAAVQRDWPDFWFLLIQSLVGLVFRGLVAFSFVETSGFEEDAP